MFLSWTQNFLTFRNLLSCTCKSCQQLFGTVEADIQCWKPRNVFGNPSCSWSSVGNSGAIVFDSTEVRKTVFRMEVLWSVFIYLNIPSWVMMWEGKAGMTALLSPARSVGWAPRCWALAYGDVSPGKWQMKHPHAGLSVWCRVFQADVSCGGQRDVWQGGLPAGTGLFFCLTSAGRD